MQKRIDAEKQGDKDRLKLMHDELARTREDAIKAAKEEDRGKEQAVIHSESQKPDSATRSDESRQGTPGKGLPPSQEADLSEQRHRTQLATETAQRKTSQDALAQIQAQAAERTASLSDKDYEKDERVVAATAALQKSVDELAGKIASGDKARLDAAEKMAKEQRFGTAKKAALTPLSMLLSLGTRPDPAVESRLRGAAEKHESDESVKKLVAEIQKQMKAGKKPDEAVKSEKKSEEKPH